MENLIIVEIVSGPTPSSEREAFLHQPLETPQGSSSRLCVLPIFRRRKAGHGLSVARDQDFLSCFCFSEQSGELLVCFARADGSHVLTPTLLMSLL
jgi:hypothetical protein